MHASEEGSLAIISTTSLRHMNILLHHSPYADASQSRSSLRRPISRCPLQDPQERFPRSNCLHTKSVNALNADSKCIHLFLRDDHLIQIRREHVLELLDPIVLISRELQLDQSRNGIKV